MDKAALTAELSGSWDDTRAARDSLVAQGETVVAAVLDVLVDVGSPVDWTVSADVLTRIGEPALLSAGGGGGAGRVAEAGRRAQWALARLDVADVGVYGPLLKHPHAPVRVVALSVFQHRGESVAGFLDQLVPSLGDPDPGVRRRAVAVFKTIGADAVPALRRLRLRPATGPRIRSGALEALAAIGGPAAIGDRDLAAWRRLTRIERPAEVPEAMHLCGSWYAVPGADQRALLEEFDLGDPEPVTLRTGASAWNHDHHNWDRRPHASCARVFVSPELDGWTLVFGDSSEDTHRIEDSDDPEKALPQVVRRRCADLSRRFGTAHWYGMSCGDGWTAWCVAEGGQVVRHYDAFAAAESEAGDVGPPHPAESGYLLPHQRPAGFPDDMYDDVDLSDAEAFAARYRQVREELGIPATCDATDIAARLSVDPGALGPHTRVTGTSLLALTSCGRAHGHPAGALRI